MALRIPVGLSENLMKLNLSKTKELVIKGRITLPSLEPIVTIKHFRIVLPTGISTDDLMERALKRMHILRLCKSSGYSVSDTIVIALFRAIIDQFSSKIFLIFLIVVSLIVAISFALSSLESFSVLFLRAKLGECVAL